MNITLKTSNFRKALALAVSAVMLFVLVPQLYGPAYAATQPKTVDVPGIGTVAYVELGASDQVDGGDSDEWYHFHGNYNGAKDFRVMSDFNYDVAYYVENYPALPATSGGLPAEKAGGLGFKLYGTSKISYIDFWKAEGLTASTLTDVGSPNPDPRGDLDLGGYDAVTRATLTYGVSHAAHTHYFDVRGYKAKAVIGEDGNTTYTLDDTSGVPQEETFYPSFAGVKNGTGYESVGAQYFGLSTAVTPASGGHASSEVFLVDKTASTSTANTIPYALSTYDVPGFSNMPVSVDARTYVESMILADMGKTVPAAFTNLNEGGRLENLWDESKTTITAQGSKGGESVTQWELKSVAVNASTGLLKHIDKSGSYGKAAPGKNEMSYELTSNGTWQDMEGAFDTQWGDYYETYVRLQPTTSVAVGSDVSAPQYFNYAYNFITAKYEYYGDVEDISGISDKTQLTTLAQLQNLKLTPKATYGTQYAADHWWGPTHKMRIELGFNFDSFRRGGTGTDTTVNGISQFGSASQKSGYYKVTLYALGHKNIEKLVYVPPRGFTLKGTGVSGTAITVTEGKSAALSAIPKFSVDGYVFKSFKWASSNTSVAKVTASGTNVSVTGVKAGTAKITGTAIVDVTTTSGGRGETAVTTTEEKEFPIEYSVTVAKPASIKLSASKATLYHKGSKSKLTLKATITGLGKAVTWKSSNTKVATVSSTGVVTAKAKGTATITATANGVKATAVITVKNATLTLKKASASIAKGKKYTIKATATPKATVTYKTSNKKIATVTKAGVVKGVKKGKATISVTANGITKKFKVTVK